jgi:hypothetical protein
MGFYVLKVTDCDVYGSGKVYFEVRFSYGLVMAQPDDLSAQRGTSESVRVCNSQT